MPCCTKRIERLVAEPILQRRRQTEAHYLTAQGAAERDAPTGGGDFVRAQPGRNGEVNKRRSGK